MKKALWIVLAASLVLGFAGLAGAADQAPAEAPAHATALADTGEYVPFWFDTTTQAICPPNNGPATCTTDRDCQLYFDPTWVCINPSGAHCGGQCGPC